MQPLRIVWSAIIGKILAGFLIHCTMCSRMHCFCLTLGLSLLLMLLFLSRGLCCCFLAALAWLRCRLGWLLGSCLLCTCQVICLLRFGLLLGLAHGFIRVFGLLLIFRFGLFGSFDLFTSFLLELRLFGNLLSFLFVLCWELNLDLMAVPRSRLWVDDLS